MNARIKILSMLAIAGMAMTSCDDDNDDRWRPAHRVVESFEDRYPDASRVEWEQEYGYYVADFNHRGFECEAWFDTDGAWMMTETDIRYTDLPAAVQDAYEASYSAWHVDDVDLLERRDAEDIYVLDIERGERDLELRYLGDGHLLNSSTGNTGGNDNWNGGAHTPTAIPDAIRSFIETTYPGAAIVDYDRERNGYEVEIRVNNQYRDVHFDTANNWTYTAWDVYQNELPDAVRNAVNRYAADNNAHVDDIDQRENANGTTTYVVEFDRNDTDIYVTFDADGNTIQ